MNLCSFVDNCKKSFKIRTKQSWRIHYLNKNTLEEIKSRLDNIEEQLSDLEDRVEKITQAEQEKDKWGQFKWPLGQHQAY